METFYFQFSSTTANNNNGERQRCVRKRYSINRPIHSFFTFIGSLRVLPTSSVYTSLVSIWLCTFFTSTHLSLRPSLSSTRGLNPFKPLLNQLKPFLLRVHLSSLGHQSRIWVSILILDYKQVSEICKASYFHILALHHIRSSLTTEAAKTIASAIVRSRHDYCNSLLAGTSVSNLAHLQLVQNTLARFVAQKSCFDHITPVLSELHWLPVCHRINFKIATIIHRVLQFQQPSYLAVLIPRYVSVRSLRSSSSLPIRVPLRKTSMATSRSFSSVAPKIWNSLPNHLSSTPTLPAFRRGLKHHFSCMLFLTVGHLVASHHLNVSHFVIQYHLLPSHH